MLLHTPVLAVVFAALPTAYEVDFRPLVAQPKGAYDYTIVLSFPGEPDVKIPTTIARKYGPGGAADSLMEALDDPRWKLKRDGERITIYGYDDVRILKVSVVSDGAAPVVRRVIALPLDKKQPDKKK